MKTTNNLLILMAILVTTACNNNMKQPDIKTSQFPVPPEAEKIDSALTIHGHTRIDPYFWMRLSDEQKTAENPDEQTQKVFDYLNAENKYTETVMKSTEELQENLFNEITGRIKQTDESVPYFKNGYWYYSRYEEGKEYPIYCRKKEHLDNVEQVLLDANKRAQNHSYYQAGGISVSPDNKLLAFGEDTVSRRIYTIRFKNIETGEILPVMIDNTTGSGAWANDNEHFFYTSKDEVSLLSNKIWRHKLGNKNDVMVYEEKDPAYYIGVYRSKSGKYITIWNSSTLSSDYHLIDADKPLSAAVNFTPREKVHEYNILHFEDKFYILTNWNAQNFRIMETPENATSKENWKEVIPQRENVLIDDFEIFRKYLVVNERKDALTNLRIINQNNNEEHYLNFSEEAYVAYISTNPEFDTNKLRFTYSSLTTPSSVYDYNMDKHTKELKKQQEVVGGHNPEEYITERLYIDSRDDVRIPVSLVYQKGTKLNGTSPMLLHAYGSYGNTIDPSFSSTRLSLLDRGFVYAIAHIRGGQAMGRQWYDEGKMFNKINTFNDYIDCAQALVNKKYTSSNHLYGMGGSAGGLLMGAVANMAPALFNGILAAVPFVDVVSTMLDETIPLTTNEFDEWGNPKNKDSYEYMLSYSPYDNVKAQKYPHMLVTTGLFDSQVQYWEPAKWVARLRDIKTDDNLLLFHCNMDAGHGGASGRFERYREAAIEYAFMFMLEDIEE
ncbi:MAG: S9 family peptidase [Prolixibacteraceae bacterium]|jgi:oligopeptidase B|nr:S9 family peptidase [Prolixibacteraceae bacterium]